MGRRQKTRPFAAAVMLPQRAALALALILIMALAAAAAAGCAPKFELTSISAESIPPEARDSILPRAENVVWRTCHEDNGLLIVACTYDWRGSESPGVLGPRFPAAKVSVFGIGEDGSLTSLGGGMVDTSNGVKFRAMPGQGMRSSNGGYLAVFRLDAVGMALDARVVKVIGVTTGGRTVEARVNNGFWGMCIENSGQHETWASLNAVSAQGKVLYRYLDDFRRP